VILRDIRARITEGLDTPDLQEADQLLETGRIVRQFASRDMPENKNASRGWRSWKS